MSANGLLVRTKYNEHKLIYSAPVFYDGDD